MMKNKLIIIIMLILLSACSILRPGQNIETIYNYRDSLITNVIDSIVVIPVERIIDVVSVYDTLKMETSISKSISYVDTTLHILRGELTNKENIKYKYKYIDRIEYRDSIVVKEIEVPVEVEKIVVKHPWYERILWIISIFSIIYIAFKLICMKIKV